MPVEYNLSRRSLGGDLSTRFSSNGLVVAQKDGKHGYVDQYGNWVIQPEYLKAEQFNELGLAKVVTATDDPTKFKTGFINADNEWMFTIDNILDIFPMVKGDLFVVESKIGEGYLSGVYDKNGKEIVPFEFDFIWLREGYILGLLNDGREIPFTNSGKRIEPQISP